MNTRAPNGFKLSPQLFKDAIASAAAGEGRRLQVVCWVQCFQRPGPLGITWSPRDAKKWPCSLSSSTARAVLSSQTCPLQFCCIGQVPATRATSATMVTTTSVGQTDGTNGANAPTGMKDTLKDNLPAGMGALRWSEEREQREQREEREEREEREDMEREREKRERERQEREPDCH